MWKWCSQQEQRKCARASLASCRAVACETLESRILLSTVPAGLHHVARFHPTYVIARGGSVPLHTSGPIGIKPSQMRHFYGIDRINFGGTSGDGTGQTIAIVDAYHDPNALSDLQAFDATFGLPDPPRFDQVNQDGGSTPPGTDPVGRGPRSWEVEESLDVEWAHAIAPRAALVLVETDSDGLPDLLAGARMAASVPGVVAVSMSFVSGESSDETSSDSTFTTPDGHNGVTFLAATGDSGSPGGYPAYSPNVVAVGGTTIQLGPGAAYGSETGWSGSGGGSSGASGGAPIEPEPAYQQSVQNSGARQIPDVSMDADPTSGVPVRDSYDFGASAPWAKFGGTSLATPMWAGLVAIADQGRASAGTSSLDGPTQTLPILYSLPQADFHDITSGSNGDFSAGPGYDQVTGLGSPVANLLVNDLAGVPPAIVPAASVVGRYVFYNDSSFDGNDPSPNAADDNAIASDKQALTPGSGPASAANYTSYSKGINGIMVDVSGLAGTPTVSDFSFLTGNTADPSGWSGAPAPAAFLLRPGAGAGGSTRIEITWTDGVIRNQWLQVTVNADANTGLTSPDVFYFGNLVGESDKAPVNGSFVVTADDELAARNDPHGFTDPAPITDATDYNKDGKVDAVDQLIARFNQDAALVVLQPLDSPRPTAYRPRRALAIPRHLTRHHRSIRHRESPTVQYPFPPTSASQPHVLGVDHMELSSASSQDELPAAEFVYQPELVNLVLIPLPVGLGPDVAGPRPRVVAALVGAEHHGITHFECSAVMHGLVPQSHKSITSDGCAGR